MATPIGLYQSVSKNQLIALFATAFLVRAFVFYGYIREGERYKQADSFDYHASTLCMSYGFGMYRTDTGEPTFWRTPGYPIFLMPFYKLWTPTGPQFSDAAPAQQAAIWAQIVTCSCIPIILLYLALLLTGNLLIAYVTAWISVFHLGLVLVCTYLLTEGIALVPFYLFLYYFYRSFKGIFATPPSITRWQDIIIAACMLVLYTWMRPMGQYVAIVSSLIMLLFSSDRWRMKGKKIVLFLSIFFIGISPWYIRNYQLTGSWFFCPMFGAYLNSFCAPRIASTVHNVELLQAWKQLGYMAEMRYRQVKPLYQQMNLYMPKEFACGDIAWPIFLSHPWLAFYDWMREVCKTLFDPYASQLVAFVQGCFFYDPLIEYLSEKIADCAYKTPMSFSMRLVVYTEFIYMILLWIGLLAGFILYILMPLMRRFNTDTDKKHLFSLWITVTPMIAAAVFMTGGFGYARLRLPIEPLLIILSLTFWYHVIVWYKHTKAIHHTHGV